MRTRLKRMFLSCFLSIFLILSIVGSSYSYTSILSFGDSLSDNGVYELLNIPPYLVGSPGNSNPNDFYGFFRVSNGPVWVEYLAQNLSVPLLDLAYGGASTSLGNLEAYSRTGDINFLSTTGLHWQVAAYAANPLLGTISANTLVTVWAGGNDMDYFYSGDLSSTPTNAVNNIAFAIQNLILLGGDYFLISNLPISNPWLAEFDPALAAVIAGLRLAYPGVNFYELDMNAFVPTGIDNPTGSWLDNSCENNPDDNLCKDGVFLSYDGVHPTTEVHQQIAAYAAASVPEPASMLLLCSGLLGLFGLRRKLKK